MKDLRNFQTTQGRWADGQFPGQTVESKLKHLQREIVEVLAKPHDLSEWADCLSLFLDAARKQGFTVQTLTDAAYAKLEINKRRTWGAPDADGVCEHVKGDNANQD